MAAGGGARRRAVIGVSPKPSVSPPSPWWDSHSSFRIVCLEKIWCGVGSCHHSTAIGMMARQPRGGPGYCWILLLLLCFAHGCSVLFCQGKASGVLWPCPKAAWRKMPLCVPRQSGTCKNHLRMPREELCPGRRSGCQKGGLRGEKQHGLLWAFLVTVALKAEIFLVVMWSEMWLLKWWL